MQKGAKPQWHDGYGSIDSLCTVLTMTVGGVIGSLMTLGLLWVANHVR